MSFDSSWVIRCSKRRNGSKGMSQWIRVDDFDKRINYSPDGWGALQVTGVTSDDYDIRNLQDAFLGTTHVVVGTDFGTQSSFSFSFNGSAVAVYGMYVGLSAPCLKNCTDWDVVVPSWTCTVDGENIESNDAFGRFPWTSYCEKHNLEDGLHIITTQIFHRNVSVQSGFYLDFIQYLPNHSSLESGLEQGYLMIDSTDPSISYTNEWFSLGTANATWTAEGFWLEFTGISLTWYSLSPHAVNILDPALVKSETINAGFSCQYTIDGHNPIQFAMAIGPNTWKPNTYNNILIQTPTLSVGKHNLTVSYLQYGHTTTLDYLIVQQGPPISTTAASSVTASPSTITHDNGGISPVQNHHLNVGAVAGGAVGGALLFIAILVYLSLYRCRKSQNADLDSIFDAEPLPTHIQLEPFKDSVEKPSATTPSDASENANPVDPTFTPRIKTAQLSRLQSTTSPFSSSMHLPVLLPQLPIPDTNIDPFLNYGSSKPGPTTNSVQLSTCEAQASSSSIHSYNRLHLHLLLAADEPNADNLQDSDSSQLDNDDPPPHRINHPDTDSDGSLELEEHDDLLGAPDPGLRASEPLSDLQVTRGVRHQHISRIVRHADSGIRLTRTRRSEDLLELPPEYTME